MSWLWLANQLLGNNYGRDPTDFKVLVVPDVCLHFKQIHRHRFVIP